MPIRKILVPLSGQYDPADIESIERAACETAFSIGARLNAHVEVFCIETGPGEARDEMARWMPHLAIEDLLNRIEAESDVPRARALELFAAVKNEFSAPASSDPNPDAGFSACFVEIADEGGGSLSARGRLADLIVAAGYSLGREGGIPGILEMALRDTGRPLLIAPSLAGRTFGQKVAIAWNGSAEAARAVGLAMDFLTIADKVFIISVDEDGSFDPSGRGLAEYLEWHGVSSTPVQVKGSAGTAGGVLLEQVKEVGADMLVMGAYTRNRVRRVVFGGVTGEVLRRMALPVLMVD
jgi:nucleotide-binding universal stress UspA family protein